MTRCKVRRVKKNKSTHKESLAASRRAVQEAASGREHAELPVVVRPPEVPRQLEDVSQRRLKANEFMKSNSPQLLSNQTSQPPTSANVVFGTAATGSEYDSMGFLAEARLAEEVGEGARLPFRESEDRRIHYYRYFKPSEVAKK